jgi:hypothetical protein
MSAEQNWPETIQEAVNRLQDELADEEIARIRQMAESELIGLHFGMGLWIRNNFGLWGGNERLRESCRAAAGTNHLHVDTMSTLIIHALWRRLQESG